MLSDLTAAEYLEWKEVHHRRPFGTLRDNYHAAIMPYVLLTAFGVKSFDPRSLTVENIAAALQESGATLSPQEEAEVVQGVLNLPPIKIDLSTFSGKKVSLKDAFPLDAVTLPPG